MTGIGLVRGDCFNFPRNGHWMFTPTSWGRSRQASPLDPSPRSVRTCYRKRRIPEEELIAIDNAYLCTYEVRSSIYHPVHTSSLCLRILNSPHGLLQENSFRTQCEVTPSSGGGAVCCKPPGTPCSSNEVRPGEKLACAVLVVGETEKNRALQTCRVLDTSMLWFEWTRPSHGFQCLLCSATYLELLLFLHLYPQKSVCGVCVGVCGCVFGTNSWTVVLSAVPLISIVRQRWTIVFVQDRQSLHMQREYTKN